MRPLTLEEIGTLRRRHLLPWRIAMGGGAVVAAIVFLPPALKGATRGEWGDAGYLLIFVVGFFGAFYMASKPIRDDLAGGFAETISGEVEQRCHRKGAFFLCIAGKKFSVAPGLYQPAQGETVTVEFLPRSGIAIQLQRSG